MYATVSANVLWFLTYKTDYRQGYIILDKNNKIYYIRHNNFVKVSQHYWIPIWAPIYTPEGPQKFFFSIYKSKKVGEMVIMNDLEWPMLSYYVIHYEKFRKKSYSEQNRKF